MAIDLNVSGAKPFCYILIGGIGYKEGSTARQLYTFTRVPPETYWAPTSAQKFIHGLHVPGEWSQNVDLWGGVATGSNLAIELQEIIQPSGIGLWSEMFALGRWTESPPVYDADGALLSGYPQTYVTETIRPTDTLIHVQSTSGFSNGSGTDAQRTIYVGLETMRYTKKTLGVVDFLSTSVSTIFTGLTRNLFPAIGDLALEHAVQNLGEARQPVVTTIPRNLFGRTIGLYCGLEYPDGSYSVEADSVRLFAGTIQSAEWVSEKSLWRLQCDDMLSFLDQKCCSYIGRRRYGDTSEVKGIAEASAVVAASTLLGISLAPPADADTDNRITFYARRLSDGVLTHSAFLVLDSFYLHPNLLFASLSSFLASQSDAVIWITMDEFADGKWTLTASASVAYRFRIKCGKAIAFQLGLTDGTYVYNEALEVAADETVTWEPEEAQANRMMWFRASTYNAELRVEQNAWFYPKPDQGDSAFPAVLVAGRGLLRYQQTIVGATAAGVVTGNTLTGVSNQPFQLYGSNRWPVDGWGAARRGSDTTGHEVQQVLAPLQGNVLKTILHLMLSTGYGAYTMGDVLNSEVYATQTTALNGTYDVFASGIGAAIPAALVDTQSFLDVAAHFDGAMVSRTYVFTEAFSLREFIDREAKLLGFTVSIVNGRITARVVPSLATASDVAATLDESNRSSETDRTSSMLSTKNIINAVSLQFGYSLADKQHLQNTNLTWPISQQENRVIRSVAMENRGIHGEVVTVSERFGTNLALRQTLYGWPLWTLRRSYVFRLWQTLAPGQIVYMTDGVPDPVTGLVASGVPDPFTGALGLVNRFAAVTNCSYNYKGGSGSVELVLLQMQAGSVKTTGGTLDAQWNRADGGWDAAAERLYVYANAYTIAPANDLDGIEVGFVLRVTDTSSADQENPPEAIVTVTAVGLDPGGDALNYVELAGQDLNALMPGGYIAPHRYVATEVPFPEPTEAVSTVFYLRDALASGSNFGQMTRDDSSGLTPTMTGTGWTVGTSGVGTSRVLTYGAEVTGFAVTSPDVVPPDNGTLKNCWRSALTITGTFPAGDWTMATWVKAVTAGGAMDGRLVFRLYRSVNQDGSGATEITSADNNCSIVTNLDTVTPQLSSGTVAIGAATLTAEYLFVSMAWLITGAGGGATHDCLIEIGDPSGTWSALTAPLLAAVTPANQLSRAIIADAGTSELSDGSVGNPFT